MSYMARMVPFAPSVNLEDHSVVSGQGHHSTCSLSARHQQRRCSSSVLPADRLSTLTAKVNRVVSRPGNSQPLSGVGESFGRSFRNKGQCESFLKSNCRSFGWEQQPDPLHQTLQQVVDYLEHLAQHDNNAHALSSCTYECEGVSVSIYPAHLHTHLNLGHRP